MRVLGAVTRQATTSSVIKTAQCAHTCGCTYITVGKIAVLDFDGQQRLFLLVLRGWRLTERDSLEPRQS